MNKKVFSNIALLFLSIIIGILLTSQFKTTIPENSFVLLNSIVGLKNEIEKNKNEIYLLKQSIEKKKQELSKLKEADDESEISEIILKEIEKMKIISGYEDVWGPGIFITVADSTETDFSEYSQEYYDIVHDIYLTNIVNELKIEGAEAISINGQRILPSSEINCGGPVIRINKRSITNPFIIKAIGDPKKLYNAISGPNGYGTFLKEYYHLNIKTQISDYIYISGHDKDIKLKYIRKSEEGD